MTQQSGTFLRVAYPGEGYDPKFELGRDFCATHLSPKFHHPMFTQTLPKTSNILRYAMTLGNDHHIDSMMSRINKRVK